jgi:hypothetical protein
VRTRLKSVAKIRDFETDLDNHCVTITCAADLDLSGTLDRLAEVNHKIKDWSIRDP